jgi:TusA-related sulfurtransferase
MKRILILSVLIGLLATPAVMACGMEASNKASGGHECPGSMKGVERTVTNLDNGARLELTSDDPAVIKTLQTHMAAEHETGGCCKDCPLSNTAWNRKVENTDKGVVLTLTTDSKNDVDKLQTAMASMAKGGCKHMGEAEKGECPRHKGEQKNTKA